MSPPRSRVLRGTLSGHSRDALPRGGTAMANRAFESRTARLRLAVKKKPYTGPTLAPGIILLYRRCQGHGRWVVKVVSPSCCEPTSGEPEGGTTIAPEIGGISNAGTPAK